MLAQYEHRAFLEGARMWICAYEQLRNVPHWHLEPELVGLQAGHATAYVGGVRYDMTAGDVLYCQPDCVHSIETTGDCRLIVLQHDRELFPFFSLRQPCFRDEYGLLPQLNLVHAELLSHRPWCAEKALCMVKCMLIDIIRHEEQLPMEITRSRSMKRLDQLVLMMEADADAADFEAAAQFMNMSEAYFSRFFKKMVGVTFSHYVNVLRIERALDVLAREPHITMSEVMRRCGFYSLRSFNRVFKELTGYTPTQLPEGFSLHRRSLVKERPFFDPTLEARTLPPMA